MKRFQMKRETKKPSPLAPLLELDIFSCLHTKDLQRRSIGFFYFPEWLNICPDCRLSWDLNIWRVGRNQSGDTRFSQTLGHRWGLALNMYWLWIEVKCRDPGWRHDRAFSAARNNPGFHHEIVEQARASEELSRHQARDQASEEAGLGLQAARESLFKDSSKQPASLQACNLLICQHEKHHFHPCSSLLPSLPFLFKQTSDHLSLRTTQFSSLFSRLPKTPEQTVRFRTASSLQAPCRNAFTRKTFWQVVTYDLTQMAKTNALGSQFGLISVGQQISE